MTEPDRITIGALGLCMSVVNPKAPQICTWCDQDTHKAGGKCTCTTACSWNGCPENTADNFVSPPVPQFRRKMTEKT